MLLCAHQPVYLPSLHLFNKIALSDALVLLGHCQFVKQSWHTRNQIRSGKGEIFLSVPVSQTNKLGQRIDETMIIQNNWKRKHLRSIQETYSKRPYFEDYYPHIEDIILKPHEKLAALNNELILKFMEWIDIKPKIFYSENFDIKKKKTDMLIEICQLFGADQYVSNEGARAYLEEEKFEQHQIQHYWQDFNHPIYDQGKEFVPNLSIIDAFFNVGPGCREMILDAGKLVK